ncbi:MAG: 5'-methylthioadenosine/adenosylhomocysteine nucleosidase [Muribaculum sp.]|nr:5'-methylthioadenosine/adenosylhomocysteine nucleosidase [Muribaculaceae bacterium]MCM1081113.1 5'-methylthioadenosine/adenosylhomocysteine nucleosidase [Muribaculum sp.]
MKIGIIVAMDAELQLLLPLLSEKKEITTASGIRMIEGRMSGHDVVVLKCGIGKVNAAVGAMALIDYASPRLIVNTGVAGGAGATDVLDVVVGRQVAYHDVWCGPGTTFGSVQGLPQKFEAPDDILGLDLLHNDPRIKIGLIASGDQFVDSPKELERIQNLYPDVAAVDMESAPIAQVCYLRSVPFVSIRVVSDTPGSGNNSAQYQDFWTSAPKRTFSALCGILEAI